MNISKVLSSQFIKVSQVEKALNIYPGTIRNGKYPKDKEEALIKFFTDLFNDLLDGVKQTITDEVKVDTVEPIKIVKPKETIKPVSTGFNLRAMLEHKADIE